MYDYLLGGTDNYAIDRQTAEHVLSQTPEARRSAVENRRFLIRAVEYLCDRGVRQFLDLGSGLPTQENVHEVAQRAGNGAAPVVYVDRDPSILTHAKALLGAQDQARYVHADVRDIPAVLDALETLQLLDFRRPVALLMVAIVHFIADEDDPAGLIRRCVDALAPGSYLVVTSASSTELAAHTRRLSAQAYTRFRFPMHLRTREEIAGMFGGLPLEPPGVVPLQEWPTAGSGQDLVVPMFGGIAKVTGVLRRASGETHMSGWTAKCGPSGVFGVSDRHDPGCRGDLDALSWASL